MKRWYLEYYHAYPNVRISFTVFAESLEEAIRLGNETVKGLRRTATYVLEK